MSFLHWSFDNSSSLLFSLSLTLPRSWLISWRYLVMNRLAVLCGHDDCLARSNFCRIIVPHSLRYQISHALRHVLWLQCKPGENWLQKQLSRTLSKRFWQRLLPGIWVFVESEWKKSRQDEPYKAGFSQWF